MKRILSILFTVMISSAVQSEDYIGASFASIDIEALGQGPTINAIIARYGTTLSDQMTGEFRLGIGLGSDNFGGVDFKINNMLGAYIKLHATAEGTNPYFIAGFTRGELSAGSIKDSDDDFSIGLGVDLSNGFNIEYMKYMDKNGVELNGLSLGMKF